MVGKYEVITLCGSTRFKDDFIKAQEFLTLTGNIVISVGLFGHADNKYGNEITTEVKEMLDDMHKRKIDMADSILVINRDDYIGRSTASEIAYAHAAGKRVNYMYPHMAECADELVPIIPSHPNNCQFSEHIVWNRETTKSEWWNCSKSKSGKYQCHVHLGISCPYMKG